MSKETHILLCVGGSRDGSRIELDKLDLQVLLPDPPPVPSINEPEDLSIPVEIKTTVYIKQTWHSDGQQRYLLAPFGLKGIFVLDALLNNYKQAR